MRNLFSPLTAMLVVVVSASAVANNRCVSDCDRFKFGDVPEPKTGYDTMGAMRAIIDGMFVFLRAKAFGDNIASIGYIGGGLFMGAYGAGTSQTSEWAQYQQQKMFKQSTDYLACVMEASISQLAYEGRQYMDDTRIVEFDNAISGVVTYIADNCGAHNCLNASKVEPSVRNKAVDAACVAPYPPVNPEVCANVKTWDAANPVLCIGRDGTGRTIEGICGVDGRCYHSDVTFRDTIDKFKELQTIFLTKGSIDYFNAFNDLWNPNAVVAYAKGAIVYLALLQELHLLGASVAQDSTMRSHITRTANWLQSRVDFLTNNTVSLSTVRDASRMTEPIQIRSSCKQVYQTWQACAEFVPDFNGPMSVCQFQPFTVGNTEPWMCACDCSTPEKQAACYKGSTTGGKTYDFVVKSLDQGMGAAAAALSEQNKQLFNSTGVYNVINTLRGMAALPQMMPEGSFQFYQNDHTPKMSCVGAVATNQGRQWVAREGVRKVGDPTSKRAV